MQISIRETAASCLSVEGTLSVRRDIFGYIWGPIDRTLSVKNHLELIGGTAFNLSIFLVGHEPDFSGEFSQDDARRMQAAIDWMRELYAQVGLGVRKLYWRYIPMAEAITDTNDFTQVDQSGVQELTESFSGPNDGIDVFFVTSVIGAGGFSFVNDFEGEGGPCDKNVQDVRTGAVLELKNTDSFTGILLAHEVGHYLGLLHAGDVTNVMGDGGGIANIDDVTEPSGGSVNLTMAQGNTMKAHCSIQPPC